MLSLSIQANLHNLIGYYCNRDQWLLVYPYMSLGSLHQHLFDMHNFIIFTYNKILLRLLSRAFCLHLNGFVQCLYLCYNMLRNLTKLLVFLFMFVLFMYIILIISVQTIWGSLYLYLLIRLVVDNVLLFFLMCLQSSTIYSMLLKLFCIIFHSFLLVFLFNNNNSKTEQK